MADFKKAIPIVIRSEGGLSKDPTDRAAANPVPDGSGYHTNKGITWATFVGSAKKVGYTATPALFYQMPKNIWEGILKLMFWDTFKGDQLKSDSVAILLADWAFGSGYYAVSNLQQVLNRAPFYKKLSEDGVMGPVTLNATNSVNQSKLFELLQAERIDYIKQVIKAKPSDQKYYNGWMDDALYTYQQAKKYIGVVAIGIGTIGFLSGAFFFTTLLT